jgi:hypothetical protein
MNFDFGEVLARAGQITWRHKNLWLAGIVISLIGFLSAPISLLFNPSFTDPSEISRQLPSILLVNGLVILLSILSIPFYVIGVTIPSLGTVQVEKGSEKLNFGELLKGAFPYFWRILGLYLLVALGMFAVVMIFVVITLLSLITFGFGAICTFPLILLFIPLTILVYAIMEQGIAAIVVDNLGFSSALQRAWELVKKNIGVIVLLSFIIYLGSAIIGMIISVPMMIPMFGFIFNNMTSEPDMQAFQSLTRNMVWWMLAFSPIYAVFQGILLTFMQAAWTLTYMRLTKPQVNAPVTLEANA